MFGNRLGLRGRATLLTASVFAILFGMFGYLAVAKLNEDIETAKLHLLHVAEKIAAEQKGIVAHADQHLRSFMRSPELRQAVMMLPQSMRPPQRECSALLAQKLKESRILMTVGLGALNGDVMCHSLQPTAAINIADRSYFREALKTKDLVISDIVLSRVNNKPSVVLARALRRDDNETLGVIWVSLDLDWLNKELARAKLPEGGRIGLFDANGMVLARYPDNEYWTGKNAHDSRLFSKVRAQSGRGTVEDLGLEGEQRILAFAPFSDTVGGRIVLWMSVPRDSVIADVERNFAFTVAMVVALLAVTLALVRVGGEKLVLRPVAKLADAASRIGRGDRAARTGVDYANGELGLLARSFDEMAQALHNKERQLLKANRALRVQSAGNRTLLRVTDETQLLREMCRAVGEAGGYHLVWVSYASDHANGAAKPMAAWGTDTAGLDEVHAKWSQTGGGPVADAIRQGAPIVIRDAATAEESSAWRAEAAQHGCASMLCLPLRMNGSVGGALGICAGEPDAFSDEEIGLLSEAAADLAFGIGMLRTREKRIELEESLKSAESRFRAAAEANPDVLFILNSRRDQNGKVVDFGFSEVNTSAETFLRMSRQDVLGRSLAEVAPFTRAGELHSKYARVVDTGTFLEEEFGVDAPGDGHKWLRQQVVPVGDGIAVSLRDVTAWKQAGDRLRESEARYRQLFDANPHPMWVYDLETLRFLMVNDAAVDHYGYARDEFLEMTIADIRPSADIPRPMERVASVDNGKTNEEGIWQHRKKDGSVIDVEITSHVIYVGDQRAEMVLAHDVTAQRRAELERWQSQKKFKTLFEQSPVGVAIIDLESRLPTEFNDLSHRQLGYTRDEFARLRIEDYEVLESTDQIGAHIAKVLRKGSDNFETQHRTKNGGVRDMHVVMRVVDLGERRCLYCIYNDITEQREREQALQRANRALRTLSAANEVLIHATEEQQLLNAVCRVVVEEGAYRAARVGYAQDDPHKSIRPMARSGQEPAYIDGHVQTWADTELGQSPMSVAIRTGKPALIRDIASSPTPAGWQEDVAKAGYASNIALPLLDNGRVIGAMSIYSSDANAFDNEEIQLLEELANDLAYGIRTLRTKAERDRIAQDHARHEEILRRSLEESIQAIADTIDMRDPYTAGHQRRVAQLPAMTS